MKSIVFSIAGIAGALAAAAAVRFAIVEPAGIAELTFPGIFDGDMIGMNEKGLAKATG